MRPWPHYQTLTGSRPLGARMLAQTRKVAQRAVEQRVVPPGEVIGGNLELAVARFDVERLPIRVVGRVAEHLEVGWREPAQVHRVDRRQRDVPQPDVRERLP